MKGKASITHDEAVIRQLHDDRELAVEYLKAALDEADDPKVLLMALRRLIQARGGLPGLK